MADGAVFAGTVDDEHHLFHAPLTGDATDLGPFGSVLMPISFAIAGDGNRVWLEAGDGGLRFVDLTTGMPSLAAIGGAQSDPISNYLWATDDTVLSHNGAEVTARSKTDGELLWSYPATGSSGGAVRGDGDLVVWTSSSDRTGQHMTSVLATAGFDEPETIATLEGGAADLVLTDDALYVLYFPGNGGIVVRVERPNTL